MGLIDLTFVGFATGGAASLCVSLGLVLLFFIGMIGSRWTQDIYAWIHDTKSSYSNWFIDKVESVFKVDEDVVLAIAVCIPPVLYMGFIFWPLTLAVILGICLAHLARFVVRVKTKLNSHVDDKNIHRGG